MLFQSTLETTDILEVFSDELTCHGGHVTESFKDDKRLFARSVLGYLKEVRPNDPLQGGVAIKAVEGKVWLYPYVFRHVCKNGAIAAQCIDARLLADLGQIDPAEAAETLRGAISACCNPDVFHANVRRMRDATLSEAELIINVMGFLSRMPGGFDPRILQSIIESFFREGDRSQFGLANAVTAVARETKDPEVKWDLEELGGSLALASPTAPRGGGRPIKAAKARRAALVA